MELEGRSATYVGGFLRRRKRAVG